MIKQGTAKKITGTNKVAALAAFAATALLAGCRQDMHNQPKFIPQRGTTFFADGRSARPQVENTVARGQLHEDSYFYTGMTNGAEGTAMPFPATMDVLQRGQERYNVYCTPCHSRVGNGVGMIVQRGYARAGNFHTARLQAAPLGHFFNVITNGYGAMPDYSAQITPEDRWAIVAYIKALQLSQNAQPSDVPASSHVQPLADIAREQGFPAGFLSEWVLPPTAVTGTPTGEPYVIPPTAPAATPKSATTSLLPENSGGVPLPSPSGQSSTGYPIQPIAPGPPK